MKNVIESMSKFGISSRLTDSLKSFQIPYAIGYRFGNLVSRKA